MVDECWWDELNNIEICEHILGADFDPAFHSTDGQGSCYVGIFDSSETRNCVGCDIGCRPCVDEPQEMRWWFDRIDARTGGYLRPRRLGNTTRRFRDAYNRVADIHPYHWQDENPDGIRDRSKHYLFLQSISAQRTGCYDNWGTNACWDIGSHSCECMPWRSLECQAGPVSPPIPIVGNRPDRWFFNHRNWPPDKNGNPPDVSCRKYTDDPPEHEVFIKEKRGQTIFASVGEYTPCSADAFVLCSSIVPPDSDCDQGTGAFGCSAIRPIDIPGRRYLEPDDSEAFWLDTLHVVDWDPRIRAYPWMSARQQREIGLRNEILSTVGTHQFGDVNFEQLEHVAPGIGSNQYLGNFDRTAIVDRESPDAPVIRTLRGTARRSGHTLTAELVIVRAIVESNWIIHKGQAWLPESGHGDHIYYLAPYVAYELQVELGIRITDNPHGIDVRYEPIARDWPLTDGGLVWREPYLDGNGAVQYRVIRPPHFVEWHGRSNTHSEPATYYRAFWATGGAPADNNCRRIPIVLGDVTVAPLPGHVDDSADPNTHYSGSIVYRFPTPPPEAP